MNILDKQWSFHSDESSVFPIGIAYDNQKYFTRDIDFNGIYCVICY